MQLCFKFISVSLLVLASVSSASVFTPFDVVNPTGSPQTYYGGKLITKMLDKRVTTLNLSNTGKLSSQTEGLAIVFVDTSQIQDNSNLTTPIFANAAAGGVVNIAYAMNRFENAAPLALLTTTEKTDHFEIDLKFKRIDVMPMNINEPDGTTFTDFNCSVTISAYDKTGTLIGTIGAGGMQANGVGADVPTGYKYRVDVVGADRQGVSVTNTTELDFTNL